MWHLLTTAAENADAAEFEARARNFFMWMAILALVVTWLWLYLRIRHRMKEPLESPPPGPEKPDEDKPAN